MESSSSSSSPPQTSPLQHAVLGIYLPTVCLPGVYVIAVTLGLYALFSRWHYDDPFITYRYADHLVRGIGLVYNVDARVLSTTTPLFALVLAVGRLVSSDLPALANLTSCLSVAVGAVCLWDLGRSWRLPLVGWSGLLLYPAFGLLIVTIGSETPFHLALCLAAFAFYARERHVACAACCALAVLARGDGILVALVLAVDFALRHRVRIWSKATMPWRAVAVFLVITAPWFIFAWAYFGEPLPVTLVAKRAQGAMLISQRFALGFPTILDWYASDWFYRLDALLAVIGLTFMIFSARQAIALVAWTALYFLAYTLLGVSNYFWYYAPLVPGIVALIGLGLSAIERGLHKLARSNSSANSHRWPAIVVFVVLGGLVILHIRQAVYIGQRPDARYAVYRAVGEWLKANTWPTARIGALEVGIIGYFAQRPMIDFAGLIQPDVAQALQPSSTYDDAALYAAERYSPDFIVLIEGSLRRFDQRYVQPQCATTHQFDGRAYGFGSNIRIYRCAH